MIAGNSLEEKTEGTSCMGHDGRPDQKVWDGAKDGSSFKMTGDCSVAILKKLEGIWNEETRFRRPKQCASECVGLF